MLLDLEVDVEDFDQVNHAHLRDANNLLDIIIDDNGYNYGIVMDLGCGSGRVTSLIDCRLRCEQIIAFDIDMKAIRYAQVNYSSPRIRYQVQDIAVPWDELDGFIKKFEGKVDLIISNRVMHWIEDKNTAIANIYRLLKRDGAFYANISTLLDVFCDLNEEERIRYNKIIQIPTEEEQMQQFSDYFNRNKFHLHMIESFHLRQIYPKDDFKSIILPYFPNLTKKFLVEKDPKKRNLIMSYGLSDYIKEAFLRLYSREIIENDGIPDKYELTYGQIRVIARK